MAAKIQNRLTMALDYAFSSVSSEVSSCQSSNKALADDCDEDNYTIVSSATTVKASNLARNNPLVRMVRKMLGVVQISDTVTISTFPAFDDCVNYSIDMI